MDGKHKREMCFCTRRENIPLASLGYQGLRFPSCAIHHPCGIRMAPDFQLLANLLTGLYIHPGAGASSFGGVF